MLLLPGTTNSRHAADGYIGAGKAFDPSRHFIVAFEASGLSRQEYQLRVQTNEAEATLLLEESLAEYDAILAKQVALRRAFESSGKTPAEFAEMYGLDQSTVSAALNRL